MITIQSMFLSVVFLLLIPLSIGYLWCDTLSVPNSFASMYVFGTFFVWAYAQLMLVPMIIKDVSFSTASIFLLSVTIVLLLIFFYRLYNNSVKANNHFKGIDLEDISKTDILCFVLLIGVVIFIIVQSARFQHTDADDSRFVVLAMDSIKSDRMLRINPATGCPLTNDLGEISKDYSSPWMIYMAYVANLCGIKGTIMIHTVFPIFLYFLITCGFWLLADVFFHDQFSMKCLFVSFIWFITVFSNFSAFNAESFIMMRIWQGKAVVAGLSIPMLLYGLINILRESSWKNWINVFIINLGSCLLSGNAIVIGAFMICSYGFVYTLIKKNYRIMICSVMVCLTNFVYYLVNQNANHFL